MPKLLLHSCCAPCSGFLARELSRDFKSQAVKIRGAYFDETDLSRLSGRRAGCEASAVRPTGFEVAIYYQNSNIWPEEEYQRRRDEAKKFFTREGFEFFEDDYNHSDWLNFIKGLESEPERGKRCEECYRYRLARVARFAKSRGFDFFASTLSISPHKDAELINRLGEEIAKEKGVEFLSGDWKAGGGFDRASALSRQEGFYRQNYCGCEFSSGTK
ncbi:MAG: epoxyqueuosine reductase QueH [Patescibacteria group bacterium]